MSVTTRPNLVYVFADQMRGSALGFLGKEPVKTPRLDAFACEGRVLTQVASTYPVCTPYRAMFMTGQYPHRNGVPANCHNFTAPYGNELRKDARCWSDVLADEGYSLGYIGKWHLDAPHEPYVDTYNNRGDMKWNEWCPPERRHGFDYWYAYGTFDRHMRPMYWTADADRDAFHFVDEWGPYHEAGKARDFLLNADGSYRKDGDPFALVVSMNPPHSPYSERPDALLEHYAEVTDAELFARPDLPAAGTEMGDFYRRHVRDYFAMVTGVDEAFGRILDAIDEAGLADDTIVIFTADHGNCLGLHGHAEKSIWWEASFQVPWIMCGPGVETSVQDDLLLSPPDIYPTLLGLLGLDHAIPEQVQGRDLSDAMCGREIVRPESQLYQWLMIDDLEGGYRGVRDHRYTLVIGEGGDIVQTNGQHKPGMTPFDAVLDEPTGMHVLLYDRIDDPYQVKNIARERPDVVRRLIDEHLYTLLKQADDPFRIKPNP